MPADDRRVTRAIDNCVRLANWQGEVWRGHVHGWVRDTFRTALDFEYTRLSRGRWHCGRDYPERGQFPALYTSVLSHVAEAEFLRHLDSRRRAAGGQIDLRTDRYRLSQLSVKLGRVFDLRHSVGRDLTCQELCHDTDFDLPQRLAVEARRRGAEAVIVWSCAVAPLCSQGNLVLFPDVLLPDSEIRDTGMWTELRALP